MSCISLFSVDVIVGTLLMLWLLFNHDTSLAAEQLLASAEVRQVLSFTQWHCHTAVSGVISFKMVSAKTEMKIILKMVAGKQSQAMEHLWEIMGDL
jgi:hypothetical protein